MLSHRQGFPRSQACPLVFLHAWPHSHPMQPLELISFPTCPYVQRSVITLLYKGKDFKITYIDLDNRPEWFDAISPLGKVPVLRVGDAHVIFESAVINEYLDETTEPQLHPKDPLQRAANRSWIEFGSTMLVDQYQLMTATTEETYTEALDSLTTKLERLERHMGPGPFFNGSRFALIDAAYAPLFMRLALIHQIRPMAALDQLPLVQGWSTALLSEPAVRGSVPNDFDKRVAEMLHKRGSVLALSSRASFT